MPRPLGKGKCCSFGQSQPRVRSLNPFLLFICMLFLVQIKGQSQDISELRREPIPKGYRSWSLFLVNNPKWLNEQDQEQLKNLHKKFRLFGEAIGRDHVAVWFSKEHQSEQHHLIDIDRSGRFCQMLKLKPSEGPYIIVTTEYPGEATVEKFPKTFPNNLKNFCIIKLNGASAGDIDQVLTKLGDILLLQEFSKLKTFSRNYWPALKRCFESLRGALLDLTNDITVTINGGPVKSEIKLGSAR